MLASCTLVRQKKNFKEDIIMKLRPLFDKVVLKKYEPSCIFCGESKAATSYRGKNVCAACLRLLAANAK